MFVVSFLHPGSAVAREMGAVMRLNWGWALEMVVLWSEGVQSFWLSMSDTPTVTKPPITKTMPAHLNQARRLLRKIVERMPKKTYTNYESNDDISNTCEDDDGTPEHLEGAGICEGESYISNTSGCHVTKCWG